MHHFETGNPISSPFDYIDENQGVNVRFAGSNLEPDEYRRFLPRLVRQLAVESGAVDPDQFTGSVHEMSNITTYERYLRLDRRWSMQFVGRNGVLQRLMDLCASDQGSKSVYHADDGTIVGYNHRLVLPKEDAIRLLSSHRYGMQIKHHHPKHVRRADDGDPLYHPKVGDLRKQPLTKHAFKWADRDRLRQEIDETIMNLLYWSDVPIEADGTTYVSDLHFEAREADEAVELVADPTSILAENQEYLLATVLRDAGECASAVLEVLAADGGGQHPSELVAKTGYVRSTIYRALATLDGVVRNDGGSVSFTSKKFEHEFARVAASPEYEIEDAADRAAKILDVQAPHLASSAWHRWCVTYAGKLAEVADSPYYTLRIDSVLSRLKSSSTPRIENVLREAIRAWRADGGDPLEIRDANVEWRSTSDTWESGIASALLR